MIKDLLTNLNSKEKARIKSEEISKLNHKGSYDDPKYGIKVEIKDITAIEDGISLYARAWKGTNQLGFGNDGTIEWEHFIIHNPPILVDDTNGTIIRKSTDIEGVEKIRKLREAPILAIQETLAHIVKLVGKENTEIISGRTGNTTSTFFPAAGAASPVDGYVYHNTSTVWATAHDAANGAAAETGEATMQASSARVTISRIYTLFDTSAIPDADVISAATYSLFVTSVNNADNDGDDFVSVVTTTPANTNNLVVGDYSQIITTEQHDTTQRKDLTSVSTSAYLDWTLNATGIASILKTGITKFGVREGHDIINSAVLDDAANVGDRLFASQADEAGTTQDPKLVVVHGAAAVASNFLLMGV